MLLDELEARPRITTGELRQIYRGEAGRGNFSRVLAEAVASGSPQLARNGAWLLRKWVDDGGRLPAADWEIIVDGLAGVTDWVAQIELCRIVAAHPELLAATPGEIAEFLRTCAAGPRPFVRAWAFTAFHALGGAHPAHRAAARRWLVKARQDPAKSVQARLRHLPRET
jgi:hypothetical protein